MADEVVLLKAVIVLGAGVAAMLGNGVVRLLLSRIDAATPPEDDVQATRARLGLLAAQQDLPGGRYVGVLERLAAYLCLVTGFPAGIAFVLAVKGLGRYADLVTASVDGSPRKGELFIIGTFASLLWAGLWGGAAYWAVRLW